MDLLSRALSCTHQASMPPQPSPSFCQAAHLPYFLFVEQKGLPNFISTKAPFSDFEKICESQIGAKKPKLVYGVTKKKKKIVPRSLASANCDDQKALIHVRKCTHCDITKTP